MEKHHLHLLFTASRYWPIIGGAELHTHKLVQALSQRHNITIVTQMDGAYHQWVRRTTILAPGRAKVYQDGPARVVRLGISPAEKLFLLPFVLYYAASRQLSQWAMDSVIGRKIERYAHTANLIHAIHTGAYYLDWLAYNIARKKNIPFVVTLYTHPTEKKLSSLHRLYQAADALIAMTAVEKNWLVSQ
ncbi:MAG: hypothetical protein D6706_15550, partial [Chloroflexi bacterium]